MPNWLDSLSDWATFLQVVGVPVAVIALIIGLIQINRADRQLKKAGETARVQILLALDESLSRFEDIRSDLNQNTLDIKADNNKVKLRRYIGTFERVGYALRVKEITLDQVDQFYGDRFKKLVEYIKKTAEAKEIIQNEEGWKDFYYLCEELRGYNNNKRKMPELP